MRDVFANEESDTSHTARRLSTRKHVPNLQRQFWMMERERERAVRFSNLEIEVLVDLIKTHIIVEARSLDCTTIAVKRKAWENITTEFWTRTSSNRTEYQLLKKWKNLKHAARKYEAAINGKEQLGPGRAPPPRSPIFEEVLEVIRKEQEALNSSRDVTMCYKVKIKEENDSYTFPESNDERLCTEGSTSWEQEKCITSQEEINYSRNNQEHSQRLENDVSEQTQHFVSNREPSIPTNKNAKRTNIVEDEGDASDDAISVGGCSVTMEKTQDIDSTLPPETQQLPDEVSTVPSNLTHLVHEKTLALKSAQLALLEKENKIKELDIKIREEQLTDIIIRRKHEQELHELRKRRMLRGLSDC